MEERRREMEKGLQALVSSAAGTKAGRQEKRVVKSGLQARFQADTEVKSFRSSP